MYTPSAMSILGMDMGAIQKVLTNANLDYIATVYHYYKIALVVQIAFTMHSHTRWLQTFNINKVSNPFSFFLYFNYYQ
jgi:hypothetical protein